MENTDARTDLNQFNHLSLSRHVTNRFEKSEEKKGNMYMPEILAKFIGKK